MATQTRPAGAGRTRGYAPLAALWVAAATPAAAGEAEAAGAAQGSIAAADVNGDGYLDLLERRGNGDERVHLNDGARGFARDGRAFAIDGFAADGFAAESFAGDGITTERVAPDAGPSPALGERPTEGAGDTVAHADFDRDGDLDIALANGGEGRRPASAVVLDPGRASAVTIADDQAPASLGVLAGDLDHDGDVDLVFLNDTAPDVVYLNLDAWAACGTVLSACFARTPLVDGAASTSYAGALADLDADGSIDLVVLDDAGIRVYYGEANGFDANPFTVPAVRLDGVARSARAGAAGAASKGESATAAYDPPPGHTSCDPAQPAAAAGAAAAKVSRVAKTGDGAQRLYDHGEPVHINLVGPACLTVELGVPYVDPGANAWTPVFGDLSDIIQVHSPVDTSKVGTYTVTYQVTDPDGYVDVARRTVFVVGNDSAAVSSEGGGGAGRTLDVLALCALALVRGLRRRIRPRAAGAEPS